MIPDHVSQEATDLIRKLLVKEPTQRISLIDAMHHGFSLKRADFDNERLQKGVDTGPVTPKSLETMVDITKFIRNAQGSQSSASCGGGASGDQVDAAVISPSSA